MSFSNPASLTRSYVGHEPWHVPSMQTGRISAEDVLQIRLLLLRGPHIDPVRRLAEGVHIAREILHDVFEAVAVGILRVLDFHLRAERLEPRVDAHGVIVRHGEIVAEQFAVQEIEIQRPLHVPRFLALARKQRRHDFFRKCAHFDLHHRDVAAKVVVVVPPTDQCLHVRRVGVLELAAGEAAEDGTVFVGDWHIVIAPFMRGYVSRTSNCCFIMPYLF